MPGHPLRLAAEVNFIYGRSYIMWQSYSSDSLKRIWREQDFSNFMTYPFHKQSEHGSFEYHLQKARFNYIWL